MRTYTLFCGNLLLIAVFTLAGGCPAIPGATGTSDQTVETELEASADAQLKAVLGEVGFTGTVESTLEKRLGRATNRKLAKLGRDLFFDKILALSNDSSCSSCHAPARGFGDTQSIAIGVGSNDLVGPGRLGVRNQRRAPMVLNTAFYPKLMWNGRFKSLSGDPFDNSGGFEFPAPEGTVKFAPFDPQVKMLLAAQAHIPSTELAEMAGFNDVEGSEAFVTRTGDAVPAPDGSGIRNEHIRSAVLTRIIENESYAKRFRRAFPEATKDEQITFAMVGTALAEFEVSLTYADAPIDKFARGDTQAMTAGQKRGALLFFGAAKCGLCHTAGPASNEMLSDFQMHVIGVPQIAPSQSNVSSPVGGENEDFGLEDITKDTNDRYKFRTSPLRNVALQATFMHNGCFTSLEDAIRHHLNVQESVANYNATRAGLDEDLTVRMGPMEPVLAHLDPLLAEPVNLSEAEFNDLTEFVRDGLLDSRLRNNTLCNLVPESVPSGRAVSTFEDCPR